tara:strand:+ start:128587 stop:130317 length:1731 start_codon:yes stop_codon:yes gene_type:complete
MTLERMSFGERIVRLFAAEGVDFIFSQGDLTMRDIQKHAVLNGIRVVGPRHETAAVFMADAYYRMSGKPQVAIGAMGPGQANLLPAVVCAGQEHVPVIVLGATRQSDVDSGVRRSRFLHAPVMDCFASICKYASRITHPGELDEKVREAFRQALSGTPGPVYLEYDFVMQESEFEFPSSILRPEQYRVVEQPASSGAIDSAVEMLANARRPCLLGGTGIHTSLSHESFEGLARILGCPVFTTIGGSGALPENDSQWFPYFSEAGQRVLHECDLVLALGTSFPETMNYGRQRAFEVGNEDRQWILVEQDASAVGVNRTVDLAIIGKLEQVLPQLCNALRDRAYEPASWDLVSHRCSYEEERRRSVRELSGANTINASALMNEARESVPNDSVVVVDSGLTVMHQLAYFEKRSRAFLWTSKYGHLGSGLPYALGAKLKVGTERPVCLISGDGGIGFHFMEFETAVRHNLAVVVIINDDEALGAEIKAHMDHIGKTIEVSFSPVRYDLMAQAMGGHGEYVDKLSDIRQAVDRAFASGKPAIVQVKTDPQGAVKYPVPYGAELSSWLMEDSKIHSAVYSD